MILTRGDKCASDVLIFDQTNPIGNSRCAGIAQRRIQSGIRNTDDDIRIYRMGSCQNRARFYTGIMDADTLNDGIRTSKVNMLKNA